MYGRRGYSSVIYTSCCNRVQYWDSWQADGVRMGVCVCVMMMVNRDVSECIC